VQIIIVVKCKQCNPKYIDSCLLISNAYKINRRFIFTMRLLGIDLNGAETFCKLMDLLRPIFQSFYDSIVKQIHIAAKSICIISLKASAQEEKMKTAEVLNVQETTELTVSGEKEAKTRQNKVSRSQGFAPRAPLCARAPPKHVTSRNREQSANQDVTMTNHEDSSGKMEVNWIREMFLRSEDLYSIQYINYIGGGDSKTYKAIVDLVPVVSGKVRRVKTNTFHSTSGARSVA
ncbi:hypothetical protein ALC60_04656, partial [Trachymyrmex zeteki]